jgi:hypothetical protein
MLTVPTIIIAAKVAAWFLLGILAFVFGLAHSRRPPGRGSAERAAAPRRGPDAG